METIDEEIEKEGSSLLRTVALTTAILAALAAIASLKAGGTVNEALALKTEATRLQAEASDQWAYYQAKGLKATVTEVSRNTWIALDKTPPAGWQKTRSVTPGRERARKSEELKSNAMKRAPSDHRCNVSFLRAVGRVPAGFDRPRRRCGADAGARWVGSRARPGRRGRVRLCISY
jgi:type II secretory pathway pseudopilin PulG